MGTAPDLWNGVLGLLVAAVPRDWWCDAAFSGGLAAFSRPLVTLTDAFLAETHAMRVDVRSAAGRRVSAVQAHVSFRQVVGRCAAEFLLEVMERRGAGGGVYTPEALFAEAEARGPLLERLLALDGTLNYGFEVAAREGERAAATK